MHHLRVIILCLGSLSASLLFNSIPAYAEASDAGAAGDTSDVSTLPASDVRVILDDIKARKYSQQQADQWKQQSRADDLEAHVRLLCWHYWEMMRTRSREREPEKWGGFEKTRRASEIASEQFREVAVDFFRRHPRAAPSVAEVVGDGFFWTAAGGDPGFAIVMYHMAFRENEMVSKPKELAEKMARTFDLITRQAAAYPDTGYALPLNRFPVPDRESQERYIAAWKKADVLLKEGGWEALRESEDENVQEMVAFLDHLADSRGAAWGWIDPAATQPKQPEPPPDWVTPPRNDSRRQEVE